MNPLDFLDVAAELALAQKSEACWRSAISRAYYAAFNVAVETLDKMGFVIPEEGESHKKITVWLDQSGDDDAKIAGAMLRSLRKERTQADYRMEIEFKSSTAPIIVPRAKKIIELLGRADKAIVKSNVESYLLKINEQFRIKVK